MATSNAAPGDGNVEFTLGAERVVLKPSIEMAMWVSRNGGFLALMDADSTPMRRLIRLDIETMAAIIRTALGHGPQAAPLLEEQIWKQGLEEVSAHLQDYLIILKNGGKRLPKQGGEGGADKNPPGGAG